MKAHVIRIGNSQGIRIPKNILQQCQLEGEVEFEARPLELIVRSLKRPRSHWAEAFQKMAQRQDDQLLDKTSATKWDKEEWEW